MPMGIFPSPLYGSHDHKHNTWMIEIPGSPVGGSFVVRFFLSFVLSVDFGKRQKFVPVPLPGVLPYDTWRLLPSP